MSNTIAAALLIDTLSSRATSTLGAALAPLKAFTKDFSEAKYVQGKSVQVSVTSAGSSTLTNPASFEAGNSTKVAVAVTMNHYSQPFHVTSAQFNSQTRLEDLIDKNLQALGETIMSVALTPFSAANFTNCSSATAQASLAATDIQTAWASVATSPRKSLLLDAVAFSKFLPTSLTSFGFTNGAPAFGFDACYLNTAWTGAVAGTYGLAVGQDAVFQASGIPDIHPAVAKLLMESGTVTIPQLGLSVQMNVWGSLAAREVWASFDLFYGAKFGGDATTGYRIKSS